MIITWINSISCCRDAVKTCSSYDKKYCKDNRYRPWLEKHCQRTCGFCTECVDKDTRCASWKEAFCEDPNYKPYMQKFCKKTCGFCVTPPPPTKQKQTSCGMDKKSGVSKFIVDGQNAKRHTWPWQARMDIKGKPGSTCGGTLIAPDVVLTAAHCLVKWNEFYLKFQDRFEKENIEITLGDHKRDANDGAEQVFGVLDFTIHEDYIEKGYSNDIALIMLDKSATLNNYVNVACLPDGNKDVDLNSKCYITGWGKTVGTDHTSLSNILQEAKLPILENSECRRRNNVKVTDKMICAGEKTGTTSGCQGDSGGPFVCRSNRKWFVQGIVSWGHYQCENKQKYTVFTRVSKYVKWIQDKMNA